MNGTSFSPAGSALFGNTSINSANDESEEQRKRRLAAIAQSQSRLGAGSNFSSRRPSSCWATASLSNAM